MFRLVQPCARSRLASRRAHAPVSLRGFSLSAAASPRPRRRSAYIARFVAFCLRFARGFYLFSSAPRIRLGVAVGPGRPARPGGPGAGATARPVRAARRWDDFVRRTFFFIHLFRGRAGRRRRLRGARWKRVAITCSTGRVCRAGGCSRLRCCAVPGGCVAAAAAAAAAAARARFHLYNGIAKEIRIGHHHHVRQSASELRQLTCN